LAAARKIILAVERAQLLDQALLRLSRRRLCLIADLACGSGNRIDRGEIQRRRAFEVRRSQLVGFDLCGERGAIGVVVFKDRVGILALRERRERPLLLVEGRDAALIADDDRLEQVAVIIDCQGQCMADAGIGRVALVMIVDGFAWMSEEDRVAVRSLRLQARQFVAALGDAVGQRGLLRAIVGIDLLAQDAAFQGARRFAHFVNSETRRKIGNRRR
jgi:hypothetical protein